MKKDRNCGMPQMPIYPTMPIPQPPMGMPVPNMMPQNYPNSVTNINTNEDELNKLEQRVNMLERRVSMLEGNNNYNNYSSNTYQML